MPRPTFSRRPKRPWTWRRWRACARARRRGQRAALDDSYEAHVASGQHDPELDVKKGFEPQWGQHSFRRQSDRVAKADMTKSGATKEMIDFFYGWNLKEMSKDMFLHYAGLDRMARLAYAYITAWM